MNREEALSELTQLRTREKQLREFINEFDLEEKYKLASNYVGKYYIETKGDSIRLLHVYGLDSESAQLLVLCISYWPSEEDSYFGIDFYSYFKPWEEDEDVIFKWKETTKDEYLKHYNEVQRRISKTII
jgi:hypothetical protein